MGEKNRVIEFDADSLSIRTRKSDNALIVTFETGEYENYKIAELMKYLIDCIYHVTVEVEQN